MARTPCLPFGKTSALRQKVDEKFLMDIHNIVINDTLAIKFSRQKYSDFFKILFGFKDFLLSLQSLN